MSFRLDLSKFKKVKEDKDYTIMRHQDGHEVKVAHSALSPKTRGELQQLHLAEGGPAIDPEKAKAVMQGSGFASPRPSESSSPSKSESSPEPKSESNSGLYKNTDSSKASDIARVFKAKGGSIPSSSYSDANPKLAESKKTPKMANGGKLSDDEIIAKKAEVDKYNNEHEDEPKQYSSEVQQRLQETDVSDDKKMADGGEINSQSVQDSPEQIVQDAKVQSPDVNAQQTAVEAPATVAPPAQAVQQASVASPQQNLGDLVDPSQQIEQGVQGQIAAAGQQATAEKALGTQEAKAYQQIQEPLVQLQKSFQDQTQANLKQRADLQQAIQSQEIDPNHFWHDKGIPSRIATGIGVMLGGFGAGVNGGPNQALNYLNSQIDRDIDAQKANLGKTQGLLAANMATFGNIKDATEMTKLMMQDQLMSQVQQAAAQSKGPLAQASAQKFIGELQAQMAPQFQQFNLRRALINSAQANGNDQAALLPALRQINPEMAKEIESRTVPGISGQAQIPLTAENRSDLFAKNNFDRKINDYIQFAQQNSGSLDPRQIAIGKAKAAELQGLYRQATHGGVYKEGEAKFIDQLVDSNPTKFANNLRGVIPKAMALKQSNLDSLNTLKSSVGLPNEQAASLASYSGQPNLTPQQQSFADWAKKNPNDPRSAVVLKKLGLQ